MHIAAVFDDREHAEAAVRDLRAHGVTRTHLCLLCRVHHAARTDAALGVALGALLGLIGAMLLGIGPFQGVDTLLAHLGRTVTLAALLGGTLGGLLGAALDRARRAREPRADPDAVLLDIDVRRNANEQALHEALTRHGGRIRVLHPR
ncbi:hypothetical protein [Deinococcus maricopensis]|uniref:Uncharacterized protein n=1 Tax=Deinococcus maricopensis (strain DSM 21211 / LMG 22137 / NRRL B-23946 / LB-34) TaxID=709986 RepID=E8UBM7_DEIML|nr:hypothetical protein [Deinococcus maricopensis]ADV68466.1 hypothetical protein Deima_2837 [Deinococcus maricopensis DSM 21211]